MHVAGRGVASVRENSGTSKLIDSETDSPLVAISPCSTVGQVVDGPVGSSVCPSE